ncbi:hypothetical protein LY90DRAFT_188103 [Neocallimastix californiae]|uniref:Uncharacterized protein n=1 Tax=Neocallimastix californiae TaxID=1754190 RepID=A0A1Y2EMK6_9FUNG|nr:hypothetical protein LY90DRAFT_188103 [Neocallimastix californiae]|eukprot:ORY72811.1 hypothetical protein LY90DRAFT_188103 [Neocallimastix californiae]
MDLSRNVPINYPNDLESKKNMIKPNLLPSNSEHNNRCHELNSADVINLDSGNPNTTHTTQNEPVNHSKLNTHQSFNNTSSCIDDIYLPNGSEIHHPYKSKGDDMLKTNKIYVSLNNHNNIMNIIDDHPNDLSVNSLNQKVGNNDKEMCNIINSNSNSDSNIDSTSKNIKNSKNNLKKKINKSKNNNNSNGFSKISKTTKYTAKKKKLVHLKQTETSVSAKKLSSSKTNISKSSKQEKQQKIKTAINKKEFNKSSHTVAKSEDEINKKSLIGNINSDLNNKDKNKKNNNINELVQNIHDENKDSKINDYNIVKNNEKKLRVLSSRNKINKIPVNSKKELNIKTRPTSINKNKYNKEINKRNNENKIYDKNSTNKSEKNEIEIVEYLYENKVDNDKNSSSLTYNKVLECDSNYVNINGTNKYLKTNIPSSNEKESFESAISINSLNGESKKSETSSAMTKKNSIKSPILRSVNRKETGKKILKPDTSNTTTPITITDESQNISSTFNEKEFYKTTVNSDLSKPSSEENLNSKELKKSNEKRNIQLASTVDINLCDKNKISINESSINSNNKINITKKEKKEKKSHKKELRTEENHKSKDDIFDLTKLPEIPNLSTKQQSSYINKKSSIKQLLEQQQINDSKPYLNSRETDQTYVKSSIKQSIPNHEPNVIYQGINNLYSDSGGKNPSKVRTTIIKNHPIPIKMAKLPVLSDLSTSTTKFPCMPLQKESAIVSSVNLNDTFPIPESNKLAPLSSLNDANKKINDLIERENLKSSENLVYMNNQHQSRSNRTVLKPISLTSDLPFNNDNTPNEIGIKESSFPLSLLNKPPIHPIKPNNQNLPDFGNSTSDPISNKTKKLNHELPFPLLRKTK